MFPNHFFLSSKNKGAVRSLTGGVVILAWLVSDTANPWTQRDKDKFRQALNDSAYRIGEQGKRYNVYLHVTFAIGELSINVAATRQNKNVWQKQILDQLHEKSFAAYQKYCENYYNCDEVPLLCVFNKEGRSWAVSANKYDENREEYSMIMKSDGEFSVFSITHELMHQFGAKDLYYPKEVEALAKRYLPQSIMNDGYEIDSLTRFLIGWTASLDRNATAFLEGTKHYTKEMIEAELEKEWKRWS